MAGPSNSYTNVFGGTPVQPTNPSYLFYTLSQATTTLSWPIQFQDTNNVTASIMNVVSEEAGYDLVLPDATIVGTGTTLLVFNTGSDSFNIQDSGLNLISAVPASAAYMFILTDNTTSRGQWIIDPFGGGTLAVTSVAATAPAQGFTITGSPITNSGTLVFALNDDLLALEDLNSTGYAIRTGNSTWATGELTTANTNLTITNPDGVASNTLFTVGPNLAGLNTVISDALTGGNIAISNNSITSTVGGIAISPIINSNASITTTGTGDILLNGISITSAGAVTGIANLTLTNLTATTIATSGLTPLSLTGNTISSTAIGSNINIIPYGGGTGAATNIVLGSATGINIQATSGVVTNNVISNVGSLSFGAGSTFSLSSTGSISTTAGGITISPSINNNLTVTTTGTGEINLKGVGIDSSNNVTGINNLTVNGTITSNQVAKAYLYASFSGSTVTITKSFNVASVVGNNGSFTITFTSPIINPCPIPGVVQSPAGSAIVLITISAINSPNSIVVRSYIYGSGSVQNNTAGTFTVVVF